MKKHLPLILLCVSVGVLIGAVVSNRTPIYLGFFQSDFDGNGDSITNANQISAAGYTNVNLADVIKSADHNGGEASVLIGSGLNYNTGTRTLSATGAASSIAASNVFSGGVLGSNTLSATSGLNGWFLGQSNAQPAWTQNGGAISNLNGANIQAGTVANSALANSSISFTDPAGIGMSGSPVSLGGSFVGSSISATPKFAGMSLTGTLNDDSVIVTNGNRLVLTSWSGPTNQVDFAISASGGLTYTTTTDMAITNFANTITSALKGFLDMDITNSTASDHTIYITATGYVANDGSRSFVVTNKSSREIRFSSSAMGVRGISQPWF